MISLASLLLLRTDTPLEVELPAKSCVIGADTCLVSLAALRTRVDFVLGVVDVLPTGFVVCFRLARFLLTGFPS